MKDVNLKNEFLDEILGETHKETETSVVNKVIGNDKLDNALSDSDYDVDLSEEYPMIPVDWIRVRATNDYSKSNIPALAENITKIGLVNPIILTAENLNDGKRYTICDGERRFTAYSSLLKKAREEDDVEGIKKYERIKCRILTKDELEYEEMIHRSANDMARDNTLYERIYRYHPTLEFFDDQARQKEYIELQYGQGSFEQYLKGDIKVKFNKASLSKYIYLLMKRDFPSVEVSSNTVRAYVSAIVESSETLKKAVMDCKVSPKESIRISAFDTLTQDKIVELMLNGSKCDEAINLMKPEGQQAEVKEEVIELSDVDYMVKTVNDMIKLKDKLGRVSELSTKKFTGNQKERYKQLKKVIKQIEVLEGLPE